MGVRTMKKGSPKDMRSKIAYACETMAGDETPHDKLSEVGPIVWELRDALRKGKLKLIKGENYK